MTKINKIVLVIIPLLLLLVLYVLTTTLIGSKSKPDKPLVQPERTYKFAYVEKGGKCQERKT